MSETPYMTVLRLLKKRFPEFRVDPSSDDPTARDESNAFAVLGVAEDMALGQVPGLAQTQRGKVAALLDDLPTGDASRTDACNHLKGAVEAAAKRLSTPQAVSGHLADLYARRVVALRAFAEFLKSVGAIKLADGLREHAVKLGFPRNDLERAVREVLPTARTGNSPPPPPPPRNSSPPPPPPPPRDTSPPPPPPPRARVRGSGRGGGARGRGGVGGRSDNAPLLIGFAVSAVFLAAVQGVIQLPNPPAAPKDPTNKSADSADKGNPAAGDGGRSTSGESGEGWGRELTEQATAAAFSANGKHVFFGNDRAYSVLDADTGKLVISGSLALKSPPVRALSVSDSVAGYFVVRTATTECALVDPNGQGGAAPTFTADDRGTILQPQLFKRCYIGGFELYPPAWKHDDCTDGGAADHVVLSRRAPGVGRASSLKLKKASNRPDYYDAPVVVSTEPSGKWAAVGYTKAGVCVYELPADDGAAVAGKTLGGWGRADAVEFSSDGRLLLTAVNRGRAADGKGALKIRVWEVGTWRVVGGLDFEYSPARRAIECFSPGGKRVVTRDAGTEVRVWAVDKLPEAKQEPVEP